jgi:hypothetical protein
MIFSGRRKIIGRVEMLRVEREAAKIPRKERMLLKKSGIILLTAFLFLMLLPAQAQPVSPEEPNVRLEANYYLISISSNNGLFDGNANTFRLKGEVVIYKGIYAGAQYTYGTSGKLRVAGVQYNEVLFSDVEAYARIPFNISSVADADMRGLPHPPLNPFYGKLVYKWSSLTTEGPATINWDVGDGVGVGAGVDSDIGNNMALYADAAYFPRMTARNVPNATPGVDYYYRAWTYKAGLRYKVRENFEAHLGYSGETHQFTNGANSYNGPVIGLGVKF